MAAESRALVPFAHRVALERLGTDDAEEEAARAAATELHLCYQALSGDCPDQAGQLAKCSRRFAKLSVALERLAIAKGQEKLWTIKPKLHLFQEMCERSLDARPSLTWTYRDEDFGGSAQALARRRGGAHSVPSISRQLLENFIGRYPVPHFA